MLRPAQRAKRARGAQRLPLMTASVPLLAEASRATSAPRTRRARSPAGSRTRRCAARGRPCTRAWASRRGWCGAAAAWPCRPRRWRHTWRCSPPAGWPGRRCSAAATRCAAPALTRSARPRPPRRLTLLGGGRLRCSGCRLSLHRCGMKACFLNNTEWRPEGTLQCAFRTHASTLQGSAH